MLENEKIIALNLHILGLVSTWTGDCLQAGLNISDSVYNQSTTSTQPSIPPEYRPA